MLQVLVSETPAMSPGPRAVLGFESDQGLCVWSGWCLLLLGKERPGPGVKGTWCDRISSLGRGVERVDTGQRVLLLCGRCVPSVSVILAFRSFCEPSPSPPDTPSHQHRGDWAWVLRFLSACDSPLLGQAGTVGEKGGGFSRPPAFLSQGALAAPWELE